MKLLTYKLTLDQLWKKWCKACEAELNSRFILNQYLYDLHTVDIQVHQMKIVHDNVLNCAGPKVIKSLKQNRYVSSNEIATQTWRSQVMIANRDYFSLIQKRKDLNILVKHYKKQHQKNEIRKTRLYHAYKRMLEYAKTINTDSKFLQDFPVMITEYPESKNGRFMVCSSYTPNPAECSIKC